jgi:hypothetical protein
MGREEGKLMGSAVLNLAAPVKDIVPWNTSCLPDIYKLRFNIVWKV